MSMLESVELSNSISSYRSFSSADHNQDTLVSQDNHVELASGLPLTLNEAHQRIMDLEKDKTLLIENVKKLQAALDAPPF